MTTLLKKYFAASLILMFSLLVGVPAALAHSGQDHGGEYGPLGPGPHYRCILVNGRWFAMNNKWFYRVHYNWDRIEARGINLEEVPCPSDYRRW